MSIPPALFISHGSPMLALDSSPAHTFLSALAAILPRPTAIVVQSPHWETPHRVLAGSAQAPATIHDFGGFDRRLAAIHYRAPGAPQLAARIVALLDAAGIASGIDDTRGLDHGVWVPLHLAFPAADLPVIPLSLDPSSSPRQHMAVGAALAPLREEGVLVIGSGSLTHNLGGLAWHDRTAPVPAYAAAFVDWLDAALMDGRQAELLDWHARAPFGTTNHPTDEHLLPLFTALGAAGAGASAHRLHASFEYGALAMHAYAFA